MPETAPQYREALGRSLGHDVGPVALWPGISSEVAISRTDYSIGDVIDVEAFPEDERAERIGQLGEFLAREGTCLLDRLRIMNEPLAGRPTAEEFFATASPEERALVLDYEEFLEDQGIDPLTPRC